MKLHRYVDHQRLHIVTKDVISLSISVLLLFRHYISHKITFGAPSSIMQCLRCFYLYAKLRNEHFHLERLKKGGNRSKKILVNDLRYVETCRQIDKIQ